MESTDFKMTHPLVLGAAASVMVVSLAGAAASGGLLPNARSDKIDTPAQRSAPAADSARHGVSKLAAREDSACASSTALWSPVLESRNPGEIGGHHVIPSEKLF
ncbi:MAG: hypothetical protein ACTS6J_08600 [Burkholderiales bacterium]